MLTFPRVALLLCSSLVACSGNSPGAAKPSGGAGSGGSAGAGNAGAGGAGSGGTGLAGSGATGGAGSGGSGGAGSGGAGSGGAGGACDARTVLRPPCPDAAFDPGPMAAWTHGDCIADPLNCSPVVTALGAARHRAIDAIVAEGSEQWVVGKLGYGVTDKDLKGETVRVFVREGCGAWRMAGTTLSSIEAQHDAEAMHVRELLGPDVVDDGGRVFFRLDPPLPRGDHEVRLVVAGDLSVARSTLHVWPRGTPMVVSDIDGTLTTNETDGLWSVFDPAAPTARPSAPELIAAYASKGFRVLLMTARPEMLTPGTHDWAVAKGMPVDAFHLSQGNFGESGQAATDYKLGYLRVLVAQGMQVAWAHGNTTTDLAAYLMGGVPPEHARMFQLDGDLMGAVRIDDYATEVARVACLPPVGP